MSKSVWPTPTGGFTLSITGATTGALLLVGVARSVKDARRSIEGIDLLATTGREWLIPLPYPLMLADALGFSLDSIAFDCRGRKHDRSNACNQRGRQNTLSLGRGTG